MEEEEEVVWDMMLCCWRVGPLNPWEWRHYIPLWHWELLIQKCSITSQKTGILNYTAV